MKLVITGASGYIGQRLAGLAMQHGHTVVAATRTAPQDESLIWMRYDLFDNLPVELPADTDVLIHLAVNAAAATDEAGEQEAQAADALIAAARRVTAKLIFVSSQTARPDAPTAYGRTKWRIEQKMLAAGGWIVRPGQVYGGKAQGLFGSLSGIVKKLPVLPAFFPAPMIQPIHVDDLATGLMRVAEHEVTSGILSLAAPEAVSFTRFLAAIAKWRVRRSRIFIPIPVGLVRLAVRVTRGKLSRLNSLFDLPLMETGRDIECLGIVLRPLKDGMCRSGKGRRHLLREGNAMLQYILKVSPGSALLRRYVRVVERLRGGKALHLAFWFIRFPVLLALLDAKSHQTGTWGTEFAWRLDATAALAEATPQGARRFLGIGQRSGFLISAMRMSWALVGELFWRTVGILSYPFLFWWLRRKA